MKKLFQANYLITMVFVLLPFFLNAQGDRADSLEKALLRTNQPLEKADILAQLFDEVQYSDPEKALRIAREINSIRSFVGKNKGATRLESLNLIGLAFMTLNQNDSALFYFQQVTDLSMAYNDSVYLSKSYNNIGVLNGYQGNYDTTIYYFNKSAEIDEILGDIEGAMISYMNIGSLLMQLDRLDSARFFLTNALNAAIKTNNSNLIATGYLNLGSLEQKAEKYADANQYYFRVLEIGEKIGNNELISMAYRDLSLLFQEQEQYKEAIEYDNKCLEYALKSDDFDAAQAAFFGLAVSYENLGMFKEAYENHKQFAAFQDTIRERQNHDKVVEMQEKFKSEQTTKENQILSKDNKIKDLEIAQNSEKLANSRIIIISSILGLVLLVILAFTLYNRNVLKQKANLKLQQANEIIEEKNKDILDSIKYARRIQEAILPPPHLAKKILPENFILYKPKDIVSGDFYFLDKRAEHLIVAAVDCTGHGVPGALMSVVGHNGLTRAIKERELTKPSDILDFLNRSVNETLRQTYEESAVKDGMDIALCSFDTKKNIIQFAGAHNPLWRIRNNELTEIRADKQPIGAFMGEFQQPFTNHELDMETGDVFYIFTDGYADQFGGERGKKFKSSQLKALLLSIYTKSMAEQKKIVLEVFNAWKGELEQVDDVCIIGLRV
jgi:serine phosphatase RsbU (regulator of sigma subunit)